MTDKNLQSAFNIAVKFGFCGDCRWGFDSRKCHEYDCYVHSVKILKDLIEKQDKYRWHDLRENPDDLPEDCEEVYIYFEYFRYGDHNRMFTTYGTGYAYDGKFSNFVNGSTGWRKLKILAWRHIELFEEVSE